MNVLDPLNDEFAKIDKVGNILYFLAKHVKHSYITNISKLLYIIDEISIKETGLQVTDLHYHIAKNGPLATTVYSDLKTGKSLLFNNYINLKAGDSFISIKPNPDHTFNDNDFTEYEIDLLHRVVKDFGAKETSDLIDYTHREGSPWFKVVNENKIDFKQLDGYVTPYFIDFSILLTDPYKRNIYLNSKNTI